MPSSLSKRRPTSTNQTLDTLADQLAPVLRVQSAVRDRAHASVDVSAARARIRAGRPAFDATSMLLSAGDLSAAYRRARSALEDTGLVSPTRAGELHGRSIDAGEMLHAWAVGDFMPIGGSTAPARTVAAVVGNAVLGRAAADVTKSFSLAAWKRPHCPCCGASPDLALVTPRTRTLVCWRCDTRWRIESHGCLGCGATDAPSIARVQSPYRAYELTICNACGRYIKQRRGAPAHPLLVERTLTASLDEAARRRGLRA